MMSGIQQEDVTHVQGENVADIEREGEAYIKKEDEADTEEEKVAVTIGDGEPIHRNERTRTPLNDKQSSVAPGAEHSSESNGIQAPGTKVWVVLTCHQNSSTWTKFNSLTDCVGVYDALSNAEAVIRRLVRERPPLNATVEAFLADEQRCVRIRDDAGAVKVVGYKYFTAEGLAMAVWAEEKVVKADAGVEDFAGRSAFDSGMVTYLIEGKR